MLNLPFMDELLKVLGAQAANYVIPRAVRQIRSYLQSQDESRIRGFLLELGCLTNGSIRELVQQWNAAQRTPLADTELEGLNAILINLKDGVHYVSTHGSLRSSFVDARLVIEQFMDDLQPHLAAGQRVAEGHEWVLERFLGKGAFGEVWMASNPGHPQPRAYKFFTRPDAAEVLQREKDNLFEVQRSLRHPNIIQYIDVAAEESPPFVALEYASGGSLDDWIRESPDRRARIQLSEIMTDLIDAMATAHEKRIYHRDLKPANIVLTTSHPFQPKITDFGLANFGNDLLGADAGLAGTPMYLPPETQSPLVIGDPALCDVFALGVIWYQLYANRIEVPPYNFAERLLEHGAGSHTVRLIERCLASPDRRFASAVELKEAQRDLVPIRESVPEGEFDVQYIFREYHGKSNS